jgi:HK97 family phage prohead protease
MEIRIREDSVEIEGYVNAVERNSKPLWSRMGQFVERVCKGAFKKALKRNDNIRILLNHNPERDLGGTKDGNLELNEDAIGLHARATITDKDVIEDAKNGNLVGWSFGFADTENGVERSVDSETGLPLRKLKDMDLYEVSILNRAKSPAYDGTLVTVRADEQMQFRSETFLDEINVEYCSTDEEVEETRTEPEQDDEPVANTEVDYSEYEKMISEMKGDSK